MKVKPEIYLKRIPDSDCTEQAFIKKFGMDIYRQWTIMNKKYGLKRGMQNV